ncbi:MAG: hypothetical protein KUG79_05300 [Pseudomonadales bacterium]|nr:hypothetical protein [Pseudomonadales bacterium]
MASDKLDPGDLFNSNWRELRTEISSWDDAEAGMEGADGLTRYWCPEAVFEVYWTAERVIGSPYQIYLTEDLTLAGFKRQLAWKPDLDWKRALAVSIGWQQDVLALLVQKSGMQLTLFEE